MTSAGAMNGAVLAYGLLKDGDDGARQALHDFWHAVAESAERYNPLRWMPWLKGKHGFGLDHSPLYVFADMVLRIFSPYQFDPHNLNPLREVLERQVDFTAQAMSNPAVPVRDQRRDGDDVLHGRRYLRGRRAGIHMPADTLSGGHDRRSTLLGRSLHGQPGHLSADLSLQTRDVVIVHITPLVRRGVPSTAAEILNRIGETSFNSSLMREMRAIPFVTDLIWQGQIDRDEMKEMLIHSIRSDEAMCVLSMSSKYNVDWGFLCELRDNGQRTVEEWLMRHCRYIGRQSSIDIRKEFL